MKRIAAATIILAAGFPAVGSAMAQEQKVAANIPFAFSLNGRSLPAGHYTIASDFNNPDVLRVDDQEDSVHMMALASHGGSDAQKNDTLVFHRYGNQYFLAAIRSNSASMNCHLIPSKQETWAKVQTQTASLRVDNKVLIPLE